MQDQLLIHCFIYILHDFQQCLQAKAEAENRNRSFRDCCVQNRSSYKHHEFSVLNIANFYLVTFQMECFLNQLFHISIHDLLQRRAFSAILCLSFPEVFSSSDKAVLIAASMLRTPLFTSFRSLPVLVATKPWLRLLRVCVDMASGGNFPRWICMRSHLKSQESNCLERLACVC